MEEKKKKPLLWLGVGLTIYSILACGAVSWWMLFVKGDPPYHVGDFYGIHASIAFVGFILAGPVGMMAGEQ